MPPNDARKVETRNSGSQSWQALVDELRRTTDIARMRELVMLLEQAIFYRQQDLALNADKIDKRKIEEEEKGLKEALDLMLELKSQKLGFPAIK